MQSPLFPPGYPEELKKYGYPPPFPPGYPPQQYEKYGYPPRSSLDHHHDSSSIEHQQETPTPTSVSFNHQDCPVAGYSLPLGPDSYIAIAGNVYNSGFNVNKSSSQTSGDVQVGNHSN